MPTLIPRAPVHVLALLRSGFRSAVVLAVALLLGFAPCNATEGDEVLFIGNSYTYGAGLPEMKSLGGLPKLVQALARDQGKPLSGEMLVAGGKDLGFHLQQAGTASRLSAKKWSWVVLQDLSTKATRVGNVTEFFQNGEVFYGKIRASSPDTKIVLYQTWARGKLSTFYHGGTRSDGFPDQAAMLDDIRSNYAEQERRLEALEPGEQVYVAPVGDAFRRCEERFPSIILHNDDHHHASLHGLYLAALVFYATLYPEAVLPGALSEFPGWRIDPEIAAQLQTVAAETISAQASAP